MTLTFNAGTTIRIHSEDGFDEKLNNHTVKDWREERQPVYVKTSRPGEKIEATPATPPKRILSFDPPLERFPMGSCTVTIPIIGGNLFYSGSFDDSGKFHVTETATDSPDFPNK